MPVPTPNEIRSEIAAQIAASESVFRILGSPESQVYKLANANKSNNGEIDRDRFTDYFSKMLEKSIHQSDIARAELIKPR